MKSNLKGFAENVLFVLNILIVFFLLFESRVVIPNWMVPVGRMHPMILHFPIAILILAMVLEFFRFKNQYQSQVFYQKFTSNLLLIGLLSAAVTVVMGLFLSKEEGYSGSVLQWHKWTGISIVFFASLVYFFRNYRWYNHLVAKGGAIITIVCLILAGHYGAILTHGDSFVLGPIMPQEAIPQVPLDQAKVYDDLIQPVFKAKCNSCHNPEKIKGELLLTDEASILKGGKTGKLFVAGKPEISLLLQRIHLPLEDKKHMPPSGKPQLTTEEALLLHLWVKRGADFKAKVIDLPADDSLRKLAAAILKPVAEVAYTFTAADEKTVKKLNNDYRTVVPLAGGSPALSVSIYNRKNYNPKILDELREVKKQIVSLSLDNLPVKDEELKTISEFENVEVLNLNATDVTGEGLKHLVNLKRLKTLSLSGSKVSYQNLQLIKNFKSLKTLTVWNTGIADNQVQQLKKANNTIQIISGYKDDGKPIKLNLPMLKNATPVFKQTIITKITHPIRGVELRYTTDGTDPDSLKSAVYTKGILLDEHTSMRVKAFKKGWISSDVAEFKFYKSTYTPDSIALVHQAVDRFSANGAKTLVDNELAELVNLSNRWLGFDKKDMEVMMWFDKPVKLSSVMIQNVTLPIFLILPPGNIEVWGGPDKDHLKLLGSSKPVVPKVAGVSVFTDNYVDLKPTTVSYIHIKAKTQFSLLVDEIFLN
ncbi:cytochrome C [Mucilaginibacter hurinus]|uniref:Cytochrome C n=1 Tax=Mucilaginibacter hurinus TaxID=2201324 RepID=A0A367GRG8_9SPHI|nr:FN3 associated domain-containing protein [Mucilaginibacter hurinus]RCH56054.1 cytochrome C [Mucilaginibacter hurinus]